MKEILEKQVNNIKPLIEKQGLILYDWELIEEESTTFFRLYIDSNEGITLNDCVQVNNVISDYLDTDDILDEAYVLEVTSPGVIRNLKEPWHFEKQINNMVSFELVTTNDMFSDVKFEAIIKDVQDDVVFLEDGRFLLISDVKKAETIYNF